MYCPECGGEYREGFSECDDCGVALVERPPSPSADDELVSVFRSADAALLPVIKSVLASADIPFTVQGDEASGLFPFGSAGGGADARRLGAVVRVPASRAEEAEELLEEVSTDPPPADDGENDEQDDQQPGTREESSDV